MVILFLFNSKSYNLLNRVVSETFGSKIKTGPWKTKKCLTIHYIHFILCNSENATSLYVL